MGLLNEAASPALFRHALHLGATPVLIIRSQAGSQNIVYANPAFERMSGHTAETLCGRDWSLLCWEGRECYAPRSLRSAMCHRQEGGETFRGRSGNGSPILLEMHVSPLPEDVSDGSFYVAVIRDVTAARAEQEQLEYRACHDAL